MDRKEEFREAIRKTSKYLFSHHRKEEHYRCYSLSFFSRKVHLCSRCTGIYPGIFVGIAQLHLATVLPLYLVALSGVPTLIEKYFTGVKRFRGYNWLRTLTGFILGLGYVNGVYLLLKDPLSPELLLIGSLYLIAAVYLILRQRQKDRAPK
jgi:uncharacterized membrane protein